MLTFTLDRNDQEPIYIQLKQHLVHQIDNGIIAPGERLPSSRELAKQLGVARISVVTAYEELKAEGYIDARVGKGTFVVEHTGLASTQSSTVALIGTGRIQSAALTGLLKLAERSGVINFSQGAPAESFLPVSLIQEAISAVLERDGAAAIAYEDPAGYLPLRESISELVAGLGIEVDAGGVLITGGCQQALDLAIQALLNPGDVLITSNPTYAGMLDIAEARGVTPVGVPVDEHGMRTEALEALIIEHRPRLLYVAPTYHNPTGTVMPLHRRQHLLGLAARHWLPVLEDGVYEELGYSGTPPRPLKALDGEGLVLYASSFSKVLLPGMRIGYLLVGGRLYQRLARVKRAADICTPALNQRAIHFALMNGGLIEHLAQVRIACQVRREAMLDAIARYLPDARYNLPPGGLFLWVELPPDGPTTTELYVHAVQRGVAFALGALFYTDGQGKHHLRLNVAAHDPDTIVEGMQRLGKAWDELATTHRPVKRSHSTPIL